MPNKSQCNARISCNSSASPQNINNNSSTPSRNNNNVDDDNKMAYSMRCPPCAYVQPQTSLFLTLLLIVSVLFANLAAVASGSSPAAQQQQLSTKFSSPPSSSSSSSAVRAQQCREGCFEKYATKEMLCQQNSECLTCWDECAKPPPPKINKSIRETWSLHTVAMLQQDSLVLVDVAWLPLSTPNQCLVTWEVAGGGLMGNLLTESFNVQLSLWPDTKYRVQVTCKNKLTGAMSRSLPLTIDTAEAITPQDHANEQEQQQPPQQQQQQHNQQQYAATTTITTLLPVAKQTAAATTNLNDFANSIADENSVEQEPSVNRQPPYEDESSAEAINQLHTNFIFNWHANNNNNYNNNNNEISAIEPLHKPDLNILTIAALSDMRQPLLFGLIVGTITLSLILVIVCVMRQERIRGGAPNDKTALFGEDVHAVVVSMPPTEGAAATTSHAAAAAAAAAVYASEEEVCKHPAMCSRNALKV